MATQFISRVERQVFGTANESLPGPGAYSIEPQTATLLPNFHSFGQAQRKAEFELQRERMGTTPPPTKHNTSGSLLLVR